MKQYIPGIVGGGLIVITIVVMTAMGIIIGDASHSRGFTIATSEKKKLPHINGLSKFLFVRINSSFKVCQIRSLYCS